jgi:hypothetical protein
VILCCVFLCVGQNKKLVPTWNLVGLLYLNIKQLSFLQKMSAKKGKIPGEYKQLQPNVK